MNKKKEKVLVVPREIFFKKEYWQGIKTKDLDYYLELIRNNHSFKAREEVEENDSWQQVIPYILFNYQDRFFAYYYLDKANESRLVNNYILGVGGHINLIDLAPGEDLFQKAANREWEEEVSYQGNLLEKKLVGIVNYDGRAVEAVHLGLVYHFTGDSPAISVREKDVLKGELVSLSDLAEYVKNTEGWTPIIFNEYLSQFLDAKKSL